MSMLRQRTYKKDQNKIFRDEKYIWYENYVAWD